MNEIGSMFTISERHANFKFWEEKRCQTFSFIYLIICVDSQPGLVPISLSDKSSTKSIYWKIVHHLCVAESNKSLHLQKVFWILLQYVIISSKLKLYLLHFHKCQYNIVYIEQGKDWIFSCKNGNIPIKRRSSPAPVKSEKLLMINWTSPKSSFMSLAGVKLSILYC